jgi:putative tryptophan/tyrosine transport system substrate-binding protein
MMNRRAFVTGLGAVLATPITAGALQTGKIPRLGMIFLGSPPNPLLEAFKQGLRELGYVEGHNVSIEYRWAEGRDERLPALASDLVRLKVDVIVAAGQGAVAAKRATTVTPIVMSIVTDPVRLGLVASLAKPGGNATGFASQNDELPGKWFELVKETLPKVFRVAVLFQPTYDGGVQLKASEVAARSLGVHLQALKVERPDDIAGAFSEAKKNRAEALIVSAASLFYAERSRLVEFAAKHRLPTMYHQSEFVVDSGGLMSYGQTSAICTDGPRLTWTKSSRAPSPPTCPSSNPPSSSWSSTSRPPRPSALPFRRHCC